MRRVGIYGDRLRVGRPGTVAFGVNAWVVNPQLQIPKPLNHKALAKILGCYPKRVCVPTQNILWAQNRYLSPKP